MRDLILGSTVAVRLGWRVQYEAFQIQGCGLGSGPEALRRVEAFRFIKLELASSCPAKN